MSIAQFFTPRWIILYVFISASLCVHFRGRVRLKLLRQLGNHATLMAPYNILMYLFSAVPAKPILDVGDFPELRPLRENWRIMREEALQLLDQGSIRGAIQHNDLGFNSFFKNGWKRFYVKWYGAPLPSAESLCPQTLALIQSVPSVNAAMFALLPPGARLNPHRDPFAGSLRYHLGLVTPNSDACRIYIDGEPYSWRDGEDIVFDETYIHSAENGTDQLRIILFCDVVRPLRTPIMRAFNRFVSRTLIRASSTQNIDTEEVGLLNRIYGLGGHGGQFLKRLKREHRLVFQSTKYLLIAGVAYVVLFVL